MASTSAKPYMPRNIVRACSSQQSLIHGRGVLTLPHRYCIWGTMPQNSPQSHPDQSGAGNSAMTSSHSDRLKRPKALHTRHQRDVGSRCGSCPACKPLTASRKPPQCLSAASCGAQALGYHCSALISQSMLAAQRTPYQKKLRASLCNARGTCAVRSCGEHTVPKIHFGAALKVKSAKILPRDDKVSLNPACCVVVLPRHRDPLLIPVVVLAPHLLSNCLSDPAAQLLHDIWDPRL